MPARHRPHETAALVLQRVGPGPQAVADVLAAGVSPGRLRAAVAAGTLTQVRRGVVAVAAGSPGDDGGPRRDAAAEHLRTAGAALLVLGDDSVVSHESSGLIHGLPAILPSYRPDHVVVTAPRHGRIVAGTHRRLGDVPEQDRVVVAGVVCTGVARTALDLARRRPLHQSLMVLDAAAAVVGVEELWASYERLTWIRDRRGLESALLSTDPRAESPLESASRGRMVEARLPVPELQVWITDASLRRHRVDFLWRAQRVVGEADGWGKYADLDVLREEKRREDALRDVGFTVVRWTSDELWRTPDLVLARIRRSLSR